MRGCDVLQEGDVWLYRPLVHKGAWEDRERVIAIPKRAQAILGPFLKADPAAYLFSPAEVWRWRRENRAAKPRASVRKTPRYPSEVRRLEKAKRLAAQRTPKRAKRDHYDTASYRRAIEYGIRKAKAAGVMLPHWHPHQLRHAIATEISREIGQQAAQRWLGHASLNTTDIYAAKTILELMQIARELDRRWEAEAEPSGAGSLPATASAH